ncbi:hypothetical protein [Cellulomonas denverensis]
MSWMQIGAAIVVGAHGIGHVLGWGPVLGVPGLPADALGSWLVGGAAARAVAVLLFGVPTAGFLVTAFALRAGPSWLRGVALASAVASLVAVAVFPRAFPTGSLVGSVLVNLAVMVLVVRVPG